MKSKYRNKKTIIDGLTFDSIKESKRYLQLKIMFKAGLIYDLQMQVKFEIIIKGEKICTYAADFFYYDFKTDKKIVEDVKGFKTPVYNLKKKLMKAVLGIEIKEV